MTEHDYDVVIVGSGAGGGTVAQALAPLVQQNRISILVLEQGPRLEDHEFTGREMEMARDLYLDSGGFLTADGTMTLAAGQAYGGSTVVYTGTSLPPPARVIRGWSVPGLNPDELQERARAYAEANHVHLLPDEEINENNRLFVKGCRSIGARAEQFPVNVKGCLGSSLCNLGCPNAAKQGTNRVQLPAAERQGVEVVTRAEALRVEEGAVTVRVSSPQPGRKGLPSEWPPGEHRVGARIVVLAGGSLGTPTLMLRSGFGSQLPRLGHGFTCHPAFILVAEHPRPIENDLGHPKSYYLDRAEAEGFVLETCMYFPFTTAKNLSGMGSEHAGFMEAFPRLQMILVLACDEAVEGNRVTVDRGGSPKVHYRFTPSVRERMARATRAAAHIFFGAGAVRVHAPLARPHGVDASEREALEARIRPDHFIPGTVSVSAAHLMGGAGMGTSAADSVTDSRGRVHGLPWLRVADGSLFPDALQINPYLTIMALADRVAEGIRQDLDE